MILSFKEQFERPIIHGTKIHTIRKDKHDRWRIGQNIHFATGTRTKKYKQFMVGKCKSVQYILLVNHGNHIYCKIEVSPNKYVHSDCTTFENNQSILLLVNQVASNDGLNVIEFKKWFIPEDGDKFEGKIIHWTDFKYQ